MTRQRVKLRTPLPAYASRLLTLALALALIWYGLMVVLLAAKVSPHTVNEISAYRSVYDWTAGLTPATFTTAVSLIAGFGGLLVLLVFLYLAYKDLPRPYLARGEVDLGRNGRGATVIRPRAVERVAELAARGNPNVTAAAGRLGDRELTVNVGIRRPRLVAETLTDVQARVGAALGTHDLPDLPVNVTLTDYTRTTRRELT